MFAPKTISNAKDASVNTTLYLDANIQITALADKCIDLEKLLMDKNVNKQVIYNNMTDSVHTQILKQELNKFNKKI